MSLRNKWIVITRPSHQAENFRAKLVKAEAHPILFPLLEITSPDNLALAKQQLESLDDYDLIIFVSANAVKQAFKWIDVASLDNMKVATTGKKTALVLTKLGVKIDFCPEQIFNSEALLAMPEFQSFCKDHKIAIIRGEGGRNLLRDSLVTIGANVDYINVYKRSCPQQSLQLLEQHWKYKELDMVLLTSETSVANFFNLAKNETWVNELTLVLGSPRMQEKIPSSFQGKLHIADDPSDETLYKVIDSSS